VKHLGLQGLARETFGHLARRQHRVCCRPLHHASHGPPPPYASLQGRMTTAPVVAWGSHPPPFTGEGDRRRRWWGGSGLCGWGKAAPNAGVATSEDWVRPLGLELSIGHPAWAAPKNKRRALGPPLTKMQMIPDYSAVAGLPAVRKAGSSTSGCGALAGSVPGAPSWGRGPRRRRLRSRRRGPSPSP
jgi:hypothetical protein